MKKIQALLALTLILTQTAFASQSATTGQAGPTSDSSISISDITTNDTSTTMHGFQPKLPAIPTFVALGASAHGTGALSVSLPTGHTTNDILLCFVQSSNEAVTAPTGYSQLGPQPGYGIAVTALSNRLAIFWKRDGGSETDPITVNDSGDHTFAYMIAIRGCVTTGDPFQYGGDGFKITASTTGTAPATSTFAPNSLVVVAVATGIDGTAAVFSSWTNANLGSVTERGDDSTTDGTGGGVGVATGTLAVPGPIGSTTVTETSTSDAFATFAMIPAGYTMSGETVAKPAEIQTFCARGTDTWTKPTGAVAVRVQLMSGGGGGGGGRNAATAEGGGGAGGGEYNEKEFRASDLGATVSVVVPAGGAVSADSDGAAANNGADATFGTEPGAGVRAVKGSGASSAAASADGGNGGSGGGTTTPAATTLQTIAAGHLGTAGGNGTTTAIAGSPGEFGGGGGENGADTDAAVAAGLSRYGAGGGGGGRSTGTITVGGAGGGAAAPAQTAGGAGTDSGVLPYGASGGCSGDSTHRGGSGGYPGGGGGGGGTGSGTQGGGKGGDGCVVVTTTF